MAMSIVLRPNGDIEEINLPEEGSRFMMYKAIGCERVDVVRLTDRLDMWVDDEFLYNQKEINEPATALARSFGLTHQPYMGPVVICSWDEHGNSIDLTRDQALALLTHLLDVSG